MIKNYVLGALASPNKSARKGASQAVSAIAFLELPKKEWTEIIPTLAVNAQSTNHEFKLSSLETLGYICEELPNDALSGEQVDTILTAIIFNAIPSVTNDDVRLLALTSLSSCLHLCSKNFKAENEKNILMGKIIECLSSTNSEIRIKALQCIFEVVRCFYDYIGLTSLEQLAHATFNEIKREDSEDSGLQAIEVWSSISDIEIERETKKDPNFPSRNYIATACVALVPLLLECLKKKSAEDDDDWDLAVASACCLSLVAEVVKDSITQPVLDFVSKNIGSTEWQCRNASILAFGSILKAPQRSTMNNLVNAALPAFLKMLQDQSQPVRETTAWGFEKIAEYTYESLKVPQTFLAFMAVLIASLKDSPKISSHICFTLHNLAESLRAPEGQPTGLMSSVFRQVLQALWENAFRADAYGETINLAHSSFAALTNIVQYSAADTIPSLEPVLRMLIETFASTIKGNFTIPAKKEDFQGYLCSALQPIFGKLAGKITKEVASNFVDLLIESFKMRKTVYDEGILAMAGLIVCLGKEFIPFMPKLYPYLDFALKNTEDTTLCRVAVGCVGDLSRALEEQTAQFLPQIVPALMEILKNSETDRSLKLIIITTLGDLALATNKLYEPYLHDSLEMLKSAAALSLQPPPEVIVT